MPAVSTYSQIFTCSHLVYLVNQSYLYWHVLHEWQNGFKQNQNRVHSRGEVYHQPKLQAGQGWQNGGY